MQNKPRGIIKYALCTLYLLLLSAYVQGEKDAARSVGKASRSRKHMGSHKAKGVALGAGLLSSCLAAKRSTLAPENSSTTIPLPKEEGSRATLSHHHPLSYSTTPDIAQAPAVQRVARILRYWREELLVIRALFEVMKSKGLRNRRQCREINEEVTLRYLTLLKDVPTTSESLEREQLEGLPLLHFAMKHHSYHMARWLLGQRIPYNQRDDQGATALYRAVQYGDERMVKLLLTYGASGKVTEPGKDTPLHVAVCSQRMSIAKMLLRYGALSGATNEQGYAPLHLAVWRRDVKMTQLLLRHKANVDRKGPRGVTPLLAAIGLADVEMVALLLRYGATFSSATVNMAFKRAKKTPGEREAYQAILVLLRDAAKKKGLMPVS